MQPVQLDQKDATCSVGHKNKQPIQLDTERCNLFSWQTALAPTPTPPPTPLQTHVKPPFAWKSICAQLNMWAKVMCAKELWAKELCAKSCAQKNCVQLNRLDLSVSN
ncbi:hypothetical protein EAG_10565 [Camponotus floridanus]|uniref:Uncharacterized protein n=1 Tax=Camponotus floridanus TaxID=104421 RepID=E2AC37_CAMFO|nr:hypothetical protein EAG_10565 [Camponotus floridanus]